ncbi:MAG: iron-containing alcohol dehydrogenase [candidate division WOR-3 bacterium]
MKNFSLFIPTKYYFGWNSLEILPLKAKEIGKRAFLVTGKKFLKEKGILDKIKSMLKENGIEFFHYDNITPNPKTYEVDEGAGILKKEKCDFIIGIGGGSVMDASKGIAIMAKNKGSIWDYMMMKKEVKDALPVILVPTIPASGSEYNPGGVITNPDEKRKWFFRDDKVYPKISIVDPEFTKFLPFSYLSKGGVDIITHMLEPVLTSETYGYIQYNFSAKLIKGVIESIIKIKENKDDREARENLCYSASLALSGIPTRGIGGFAIMHWLEHILSGFYDNISHPDGLCLLLLPFIKIIKKRFSQNFKKFEEIYGEDVEKVFKDYLEKIGFKYSLKDYNVKEKDIEEFVKEYEFLMKNFPDFGFDKISLKDVEKIYLEIL